MDLTPAAHANTGKNSEGWFTRFKNWANQHGSDSTNFKGGGHPKRPASNLITDEGDGPKEERFRRHQIGSNYHLLMVKFMMQPTLLLCGLDQFAGVSDEDILLIQAKKIENPT